MNDLLRAVAHPGLIPMLGYAIGIYVLTSTIKALAARAGGRFEATVDAYVSILPVVIGMVFAPFVVPYLLFELGARGIVPLSVSLFTGAAAGGLSKSLWDLIHKIIKRRLIGGRDHEVERSEKPRL